MSRQDAATVEKIRRRGHLLAGVSKGIFGLSYQEADSQKWRGFDVDLARAIAVAVLGDPNAVEYVPISPNVRCQAVDGGVVDVGTFNASATLGRESACNVIFPQAMLYDGEAFMVRVSDIDGVNSARAIAALSERVVAIQQGTTTATNLERYFGSRGLSYQLRPYPSPQEALAAYASGDCNLYALDRIPLTGERLRLPNPGSHIIVDEPISKEAMGPVVSARDYQWVRAVTWIMRALIESEELGLSSKNCLRFSELDGPLHVTTFFHPSQDKLDCLGLQGSFPLNVLRHIGNYEEVFARNIGSASPLNLPRFKNTLWSSGGLLISPSFH
ncbi:MAG: amino acid ABC transporter substrate-binding protein [Ramlibacter sp.]|nr:amino acid ABC transporter substrate-binding protein [Ramlibacter sp.]